MTDPRPTKAQRRDEARAAAVQLRQEQERAARRQRVVVISLLVVGLVVLGGVVWAILRSGQPAPLGEQLEPTVTTERGAVVVDADGVVADPPPMTTEDGAPRATFADGAFGEDVVVVSVYADYMCPFCGLFEQTRGPVLDELREAGDVVVAYHPITILDRYSQGSEFSTRTASAAFHVAEEAPEAFVAFNALLFANQPAEGSSGLSDDEIAEIAVEAGVPQDVADDLASGSYREWAQEATGLAEEDLERLATPTILVDGEVLAGDWREDGVLEAAIEAARG